MKIIAPAYYADFKCIASACRHSCCIGWEVDIDGDALAFYETVGGDIGERIRASIDREGEPHFALGRDERCPHLLPSGLCDIICECGEGALSQICRDHPRYRNFYDGVTEIGLGLSCEAATALALGEMRGFLVAESEDMSGARLCEYYPAELFTGDERALAEEKKRLVALALDGSLTIAERLRSLLGAPVTSDEIRSLYLSLEMLDSAWGERIKRLFAEDLFRKAEGFSECAEKMLIAFLFRHINAESFYEPRTVGAFAALSTIVVTALSENESEVYDILRAYSAEIEYSVENTEKILDLLEERIYQ